MPEKVAEQQLRTFGQRFLDLVVRGKSTPGHHLPQELDPGRTRVAAMVPGGGIYSDGWVNTNEFEDPLYRCISVGYQIIKGQKKKLVAIK